MEWTGDLVGVLLLVAGAALLFKSKQRRFKRTNEFGVERFPNFLEKLRGRSSDYVLVGGSIASLAIGTIMLASNHVDSWGWVVMAPVCVFMLYLLLGA